MVNNQQFFYISPELYLEGERVSPIKHEYRRGQVYAMVGAKKPHIVLASNLTKILGNHLENSPCLVLNSDIKVRLEEANCYYYPDIAVVCDEREINNTDDFILYPVLIIEVLSKSTEAFDRGDKFIDYQTCPTLKEYILIHQNQQKIECYRRDELGIWTEQIYSKGDNLEFKSVNYCGKIEDIYRILHLLKIHESL
ncbi:Uma2 family endonuclease [Crocosphaera sp. XPORK-15E]|uniref:Uma2 family endonuclease n=1 Tax=Crocosphaera sp. XPORK-15E TaxID=3110247 RepID=UPI002B2211A3|nr:Uma2 family endonuclease [Crocosphaera sp. XPORK-15E]MEA5532653.1 Uma2 family endonuclease [Crocosphaera sp. XPORK-15E]